MVNKLVGDEAWRFNMGERPWPAILAWTKPPCKPPFGCWAKALLVIISSGVFFSGNDGSEIC